MPAKKTVKAKSKKPVKKVKKGEKKKVEEVKEVAEYIPMTEHEVLGNLKRNGKRYNKGEKYLLSESEVRWFRAHGLIM